MPVAKYKFMIIQGKFGTYDVRWGDLGFNQAEVLVFKDSPYKKWFFGLFTLKKADWNTAGRRVRTPEEVKKYTPQQLTDWFWEAVIEYEQHVLSCNSTQIAAMTANPV